MITSELIQHAKAFAQQKFDEVGGKNHFLEVYQILKDEFHIEDANILIAGLLHDTLEDTNTTKEEIEKVFSKDIADLVQEVSHPKNYTKEQKVEYYESLTHISPGAKMIKLADFTSHLRKFIGAYTGESNYPKSKDNGYVVLIQSFLESCEEIGAKKIVFDLTTKLDNYIN